MTKMNKDLLLQSIATIRDLKTRLAQAEAEAQAARGKRDDIAIVGVSLRFPGGVTDLETYWALLREGRSGIVEVDASRWSNQQFVDPDYAAAGKLVTPYAGLLERIYEFDAEFFGLSALEAENLDPQQRLLLEQSWLALEDAGLDIARLRGSDTSVVVGIGSQDYGMALLADPLHANAYVASGNSLSMAAGRLSYFYDFTGPSLSVDTACSSSLVAVHEACRHLREHDCGISLACGVNVMLTPHAGINFSRARMLTTERDCHTFDARASGYVRGEGCAVLVLKRLADARADGDRIHAVIKGIAVNHDGHSSGLTVPNGSAQRAVIRSALKDAGLLPADVDYVEAHGTGTRLGDPIEAHAIADAYGDGRQAAEPLTVGAVKANLGHLEAAAGLAGLIKAMLVVQHGEAPPQPGFETLNPAITWDAARFEVARQPTPLRQADARHWHAGVSSFGFSGTNAHAILASPPAEEPDDLNEAFVPAAADSHLIALSAKSPDALREQANALADYLRTQPATALAAISATSTLRRCALGERLAVTGRTGAELADSVQRAMAEHEPAPKPCRVVLYLTGTGASDGAALAQAHRTWLERCRAFGIEADRIVAARVEPAFIGAWLWRRPEPAGLSYLRDAVTGDAVTGDAAAGDALVALATDHEADVAAVSAAVFEGAHVLATGAPPCGLAASVRWHRIDRVEDDDAWRDALAALFSARIKIDWAPLFTTHHRVVPNFPPRRFARRTFRSPRIDAALAAPGDTWDGTRASTVHPLVRDRLAQPDGRVSYRLTMATPWLDFVDGHRVRGQRLLPASLLLELMRSVAADATGRAVATISNARFERPVDPDTALSEYLAQIEPIDGGAAPARVSIWSRRTDGATPWARHAEAICGFECAGAAAAMVDDDVWPRANWTALDVAALYARHETGGVTLDETFRCIRAMRANGDRLEAEITPAGPSTQEVLQRAARLVDGCLQASAGGREQGDGLFLLAAIGEAVLPSADALPSVLRVRLAREACDDGYCFTIALTDSAGRVVGHLRDVLFRRAQTAVAAPAPRALPSYEESWEALDWPERAPLAMHAPLPTPDTLAGIEPASSWAARFDLENYDTYRRLIETACAGIVADTLAELEAAFGPACEGPHRGPAPDRTQEPTANDRLEAERDTAAHFGIVPAQQHLFAHLLAVQARAGETVAAYDGDGAHAGARGAARLDAVDAQFPRFQGETEFLRRCADALPDVLRGRRNPLEVLFADAALGGSEAVYVTSPIAQVLNGQLAQWAASLGHHRPLRILEIGAGTGGTSRTVLDALRGLAVQTYCYTDVSPFFLERARSRFADHGCVDYRLLDIERPIADQGFAPGGFDVVIAANVLHATRSIAETLSHVRELLAPGGYLLLRECTAPRLSADLSFGMTEGWWRFEDAALRPDYAVLSTAQWEGELARSGFESVRSLPPSAASAEALIIAQATREARAERWLVVHNGQGEACVAQLAREAVAHRALSWAEALADDAGASRGPFDRIVCFADAGMHDDADPVAAATAQYEAMISFARRWLGARPGANGTGVRLWCVTRQAERVVDADRLDGLAQSVAIGVLKCAALELPGRVAGAVDLGTEPTDFAGLLAHLRNPGALRYFALREGKPYVPRLRPARPANFSRPLDGTVLITGGFGGIGYALAQALAARATTLVLAARHIDGPERQAQVQALRARGARVIAQAVDLADGRQVADLFERLAADGVTVEHIVHAAGVGGDRLLIDSAPGALREVVDAKLAGTWHLHAQAPAALRSFVVLSTMVALWGARHKTHYTLANHFADRVVQWRRARGLPASVVHLGPVDGGMLDAAGKAAAERVGVRSLALADVAHWLAGAPRQTATALLDIDWTHFKPIYRHTWLDALFAEVGATPHAGATPASDRRGKDNAAEFQRRYAAAADPDALLDELLHPLLREVLGLSSQPGSYATTGFHDLGMDSLLTLSFAEKLSARAGVPVSSVDVFDNANPARLRAWLSAKLRMAVAKAEAATEHGNTPAIPAYAPQPLAAPPVAEASNDIATDEIERELQMMQALLESR